MTDLRQGAARWEPVPDIPETPCADFSLESDETGRLRLLLRYSWIRGNQADLALDFADVRAIRTFWDGDGDGSIYDCVPRCSGTHSYYLWPLQEISRSDWLGSGNFVASVEIARARGQEPWRHYRIITLERSLDILARGSISGRWIRGAA